MFFPFETMKVILYNSRDGVLMKRLNIETLLEHSTSILCVRVNHVIIYKFITL